MSHNLISAPALEDLTDINFIIINHCHFQLVMYFWFKLASGNLEHVDLQIIFVIEFFTSGIMFLAF